MVSYAYPLVSIPLLSRVLGIDGLGVFIVTLAVIQMLLVWTDFGFGFSALRRIAVAESAAERQAVAPATITAKLALWAFGSVVLMIVVLLRPLDAAALRPVPGGRAAERRRCRPLPHVVPAGHRPTEALALLTGGSRVVALVGLILTVRSVDQLALAVFWQFLPYAAVRRRLLDRADEAEGRRRCG